MTNVIPFPRISNTECQASSMPGMTDPELRERAKQNFYSAERRAGTDHVTAYELSEAFGRDLDRINSRMEAERHG